MFWLSLSRQLLATDDQSANCFSFCGVPNIGFQVREVSMKYVVPLRHGFSIRHYNEELWVSLDRVNIPSVKENNQNLKWVSKINIDNKTKTIQGELSWCAPEQQLSWMQQAKSNKMLLFLTYSFPDCQHIPEPLYSESLLAWCTELNNNFSGRELHYPGKQQVLIGKEN